MTLSRTGIGPERRAKQERTIAVIGGSGFIGLNVTDALVRLGTAVRILDVRPPPDWALSAITQRSGDVSVSIADARNAEAVDEFLARDNYQAVIFAAVVTAGRAREEKSARAIIDANLIGLSTVLDVLAVRPPTRFVLLGSSAIFGAAAGEEIWSEDSVQAPLSLYGITKMTAERVVLRWSQVHRREALIARLGWVFGSFEHDTGFRDTLSAPYRLALAAMESQSVSFERDMSCDWLYGRDAGIAIARLATAAACRHQVYNLGPGRRLPLSKFCEMLAARFPEFRYARSRGDDGNFPLYLGADDPPLSAARYEAEFGPIVQWPPETTMADFLRHLALRTGTN